MPLQKNELFIAAMLNGKTTKELIESFQDVPKSTIYKWIKIAKASGTLKPKKSPGRPKKFSERDKRHLVRTAQG